MKFSTISTPSSDDLDRLEARTVEALFDDVWKLLERADDDRLEDFLNEMDAARARISVPESTIRSENSGDCHAHAMRAAAPEILELDRMLEEDDVVTRTVLVRRWSSRRAFAA